MSCVLLSDDQFLCSLILINISKLACQVIIVNLKSTVFINTEHKYDKIQVAYIKIVLR